MVMNHKVTGTASTIPAGLLKGTLAGLGATLLGAAGMSGLIIREVLRETAIGYCAMVVLVLASFLAAMTAMRSIKQKMAVVATLSGAFYFLVLVGSNALFLKGEYHGAGVTALLVLAGAGTALLVGLKPQKQGHSRLRKKKRR